MYSVLLISAIQIIYIMNFVIRSREFYFSYTAVHAPPYSCSTFAVHRGEMKTAASVSEFVAMVPCMNSAQLQL